MSFPVTTLTHVGTAVSTSSVTIAVASPQRTYLEIENQGSASIFVRFDGATATADKDAFRILPGDTYYAAHYMTASAVTAIAASGTQDVHVVSGAPPS